MLSGEWLTLRGVARAGCCISSALGKSASSASFPPLLFPPARWQQPSAGNWRWYRALQRLNLPWAESNPRTLCWTCAKDAPPTFSVQ